MNLDEISAFLTVVECGSFAGAARRIDCDPSVVSRRIARLEKRLGARLIVRTTRRVSLTEAGSRYLEWVQPLLAALGEAGQDVSDLAGEPRGVLRVGVSSSFGRHCVAPVLAELAAQHRDLQIDLILNNRMVDIVGDGIDVAVRTGHLQDSALTARLLCRYRTVLAESPAYLARRSTPASLSDLAGHDCLGFRLLDTWPNWTFGSTDSPFTMRPRCPVVSDDSEVLVAAAIHGAGVIRGPQWLLMRAMADGRLIELLPDEARSASVPVHAVLPPGRMAPAKVRVFVDALRAHLPRDWDR